MIALILKFFSAKRSGEAKMRSVTGKVCGVVGIFLNVLLFAVKLAAGLFSGSLSVDRRRIQQPFRRRLFGRYAYRIQAFRKEAGQTSPFRTRKVLNIFPG